MKQFVKPGGRVVFIGKKPFKPSSYINGEEKDDTVRIRKEQQAYSSESSPEDIDIDCV